MLYGLLVFLNNTVLCHQNSRKMVTIQHNPDEAMRLFCSAYPAYAGLFEQGTE